MRHIFPSIEILCIASAVATATANAATLLTSSAALPYRMDTTGPAYVITNEAGRTSLWPLTYRKGESVTATTPNGTATPLVTSAASDGTLPWSPAAGGGAWTLANDGEGEAVFRVWHSIYGLPSGAGTTAKPAQVVDAGDFDATLALAGGARSGFTFELDGISSVNSFSCPSGYAFAPQGGGVYQLITAGPGLLCLSAVSKYPMDTVKPGPDRKLKVKGDALPFAYSGDAWARTSVSAASMLTFAPQSGTAATTNCVGTGAADYALPHSGTWFVTLAPATGETLVSRIDIVSGTMLVFR